MIAPRRRLSPFFWLLLAVAVVVALLPWWRNHAYLRDLYDYGVVLKANARIAAGERPYVDFKSPMQAGFLGLNSLVERLGGGTYGGLTRGAAALIALSTVGLALLLARRWPAWAAVLVACAVTVSGASQHTIIVHNALGILYLAVATWSAACAPVVRRETWPWHVLLAAGLFLGGVNKINFQAVALVVSAAWALRAGLLRQAAWSRVGVTVGGIMAAGVILPVAAELAWTGATLSQWLASVVQLAASDRGGLVWNIFTRKFLFEPIHNFYGATVLQAVGLAGLGLSLAALVGCGTGAAGQGRPRGDRWLLLAAVVLTGGAGAALLVTNVEIAAVGLGAWLVLVCSLWLGFGANARRPVWVAGLVVPAALLGGAAWWDAWRGLRSQFGFSPAPRAEYVPAETAGPAFASLRGLRVPPDVELSLELLERTLPPPDASGRRPVFYGPGLELLDRYYPAVRDQEQPLWIHWGTSYGPAEQARLRAALVAGRPYEAVVVTVGFENWPEPLLEVLKQYYTPELVGGAVRRWMWRTPDTVDRTDSFGVQAKLGGNIDGRILHLDRQPFEFRSLPDGRTVLGTTWPEGSVLLRTPLRRFRGVAIVARLPGAGDGPVTVDFSAIVHGAVPEHARWFTKVELPAGQASVAVPFEVDASGDSIVLVSRRSDQVAGVFAGYREIEITHAIEMAGGAPQLRPEPVADTAVTPELVRLTFGDVAWRPQQLVMRGGRPGADGLGLPAGGELWLHSEAMLGEIRGEVSLAENSAPVLARVVWYKGGRLQVLQNGWIMANQPLALKAWTAEPGGWFGLLLDGDAGAAATVRLTASTVSQ
jgi:hypothetical protein